MENQNLPTQPTTNILSNQPVYTSSVFEKQIKYVSLLIRLGLIFVFAWAAVFISLTPDKYLHYLPIWVDNIIPRTTALHLFAGFEILLCIWLALGKKTYYSGIVSAFTIAALTLINYQEFGVLFRNVSIFFSSLALIVISKK